MQWVVVKPVTSCHSPWPPPYNTHSHTLNYNSTQCHWPRTLEWGWSACRNGLIHCHIKFPSSYPKLTSENHQPYYTTNYIHRLPTNLSLLPNSTKPYHIIRKLKTVTHIPANTPQIPPLLVARVEPFLLLPNIGNTNSSSGSILKTEIILTMISNILSLPQ